MKEVVHVEEEYLENILITGHHTTVLCNNTGRITWGTLACISIEGITWDQCGDPSDVSLSAIVFTNVFHISIISTTFQSFKVCQAVVLKVMNNDINVTVTNSTFLFNKVAVASDCPGSRAGLYIYTDDNSPAKHVNLTVIGSLFYGNGNPGRPKSSALLGAVLFYYFVHPTSLKAVIKDSNVSVLIYLIMLIVSVRYLFTMCLYLIIKEVSKLDRLVLLCHSIFCHLNLLKTTMEH